MSIPSVRFKPPQRKSSLHRPIPASTSKPYHFNPSLNTICFSSSDESSDIPVIQTNSKNQMKDIGLESSSDDLIKHKSNSSDNEIETNWGLKNRTSSSDVEKMNQNWSSRPQNLTSSRNVEITNQNWGSRSQNSSNSVSPKNRNFNSNWTAHSDTLLQKSLDNQSSEEPPSQSDSSQATQRKKRRVRKVRIPLPSQDQQQRPDDDQSNNDDKNNESNDTSDNIANLNITRNRTDINLMRHRRSYGNGPHNIHRNSQDLHRNINGSAQDANSNTQNMPQITQNNNNNNPSVTTNITTKTVDISTLRSESFRRHRSHTFNSGRTVNTPKVHEEKHPSELETFTVVKEVKHVKKNNADFRMMKDQNAIYFSRVSKDDIGIFYIISKTSPITPNSPDIVGQLRKHNHGKRYTVYANSEKLNDDRDAESIGMAFVKNPDFKSKQKSFRIALRKDGKINYPVSKRRELSRIAEDLDSKFPGIEVQFNKHVVPRSDGTSSNPFGSMFIVDSNKNYIINDKNNQTIFMIFKSSEASYTIKSRFPFNPLMAFGLGIAIIEDCH